MNINFLLTVLLLTPAIENTTFADANSPTRVCYENKCDYQKPDGSLFNFDFTRDFNNGFAVVAKLGEDGFLKFGFLKEDGSMLTDLIFDNATSFNSGGIAEVFKSNPGSFGFSAFLKTDGSLLEIKSSSGESLGNFAFWKVLGYDKTFEHALVIGHSFEQLLIDLKTGFITSEI